MQSSHNPQTFVIIPEQLLNMGVDQARSRNQYLAEYIQSGLFGEGEGGYIQIKNDFIYREYLCEGMENMGFPPDATISENDIYQRLADLFGVKNADNIIKAHSQLPTYVINVLLYGIETEGDNPLPNLLIQASSLEQQYIVDLFQGSDNEIYLSMSVEKFSIRDTNLNEIVGNIPGPVKILFQLARKDERFGYKLSSIETENECIYQMFLGKLFKEQEIRARFCNDTNLYSLAESVSDSTAQIESMDEEKFVEARNVLLQALENKNVSVVLNAKGKDVLNMVEDIKRNTSLESLTKLTHILEATTEIINPISLDVEEKIKAYRSNGTALRREQPLLAKLMLSLAHSALARAAYGEAMTLDLSKSGKKLQLGGSATWRGEVVLKGSSCNISSVGGGLFFLQRKIKSPEDSVQPNPEKKIGKSL